MYKFALALVFSTVAAYATVANAADVAEPPAVYDWTGFYVGGNGGYAWGGDDRVGVESNGVNGPGAPDIGKLDLNGWFGGGQIGGDWQFGSWVVGGVADIEGSTTYDDLHAFDGAGNRYHASSDIDIWGQFAAALGGPSTMCSSTVRVVWHGAMLTTT